MGQSLYERLGGAKGISGLVEDAVEAHMVHPAIKARFLPYRDKPEELANAKKHLTDFFCAGSGGPEAYTGRSLPETHRGMNISAEEYMAVIDDILATMTKHAVDEATQKDVLMIVYTLKGEIMAL